VSQLVICLCADGPKVDRDRALALAGAAAAAGRDVLVVEDFCAVAAGKGCREKIGENPTLVGCRPRALRALLAAANISGEVKDFAQAEAEYPGAAPYSGEIVKYDNPWRAWFPVMDLDRCTQCGKCRDYCLFGVYQAHGEIKVANPDHCKNNCPACARICPAGAIIFAKYPDAPVDGGEAEMPASSRTAGLSEQLRTRREQRKSIFKDRKE